MAEKKIIIDDLDGVSPAETMHFSVNGKNYAIDVNEEHWNEIQALMDQVEEKFKPYTKVARPLGSSVVKKTERPSEDVKAIREWAEKEGIEVSPRGRIKKEIKDAYYARKDR